MISEQNVNKQETEGFQGLRSVKGSSSGAKQLGYMPQYLKSDSTLPLKSKIKRIDLSHNKIMPKFYILDSISYRSDCALGNKTYIRLKDTEFIKDKSQTLTLTDRPVSREKCMAFNVFKQQAHLDTQQFVPPVDFTPFIIEHEGQQLQRKGPNLKYTYKVLDEKETKVQQKESTSPVKQTIALSKEIVSSTKFLRNSSREIKSSRQIQAYQVYPEMHNEPLVEEAPSPSKIKQAGSSLSIAFNHSSKQSLSGGILSQRSIAQVPSTSKQRSHYQLISNEEGDENSLNFFAQKINNQTTKDEVGPQLSPTRKQHLIIKTKIKESMEGSPQIPPLLISQQYQKQRKIMRASSDLNLNDLEVSGRGGIAMSQQNLIKYYIHQASINQKTRTEIDTSITRPLPNISHDNSTFPKTESPQKSLEGSTIQQTQECQYKQQSRKLSEEGKKLSLENALSISRKTLGNIRDLYHFSQNRDIQVNEIKHLVTGLILVRKLIFQHGLLRRDLTEEDIIQHIRTQYEHQKVVTDFRTAINFNQEPKSKLNQFEWEPYLELVTFNFRLTQQLDKQTNRIYIDLQENINKKQKAKKESVSLNKRSTPSREQKIKVEVSKFSNLINSINTYEKKLGKIEFVSTLTQQNYCKLTDIIRQQRFNDKIASVATINQSLNANINTQH